MQKLFPYIIVGILCLAILAIVTRPELRATSAARTDAHRYTVEVVSEYPTTRDEAGIDFSGSCFVIGADGSSESKTVEATTPKQFTYSGRSISCNYQKQRANNIRLKATLMRDGVKVKEIDTVAEYGVVSFAT